MTARACSVPGCERPYLAKGWCKFHYRRAYEGRQLDAPPRGTVRTCSVEDCDQPTNAKGMCPRHYAEAKRRAAGIGPRQYTSVRGTCARDDCGAPEHARGLCRPHYEHARTHREAMPRAALRAGGRKPTPVVECAHPNCANPRKARGLCRKHYLQVRAAERRARECTVRGCHEPKSTNGLCRAHDARARTERARAVAANPHAWVTDAMIPVPESLAAVVAARLAEHGRAVVTLPPGVRVHTPDVTCSRCHGDHADVHREPCPGQRPTRLYPVLTGRRAPQAAAAAWRR